MPHTQQLPLSTTTPLYIAAPYSYYRVWLLLSPKSIHVLNTCKQHTQWLNIHVLISYLLSSEEKETL